VFEKEMRVPKKQEGLEVREKMKKMQKQTLRKGLKTIELFVKSSLVWYSVLDKVLYKLDGRR